MNTDMVFKLKSSTISTINSQSDDSWKNKIFITLDIDWAHDDVLHDTIDLIESYDAHATFLVTHHTPVINRLMDNPKIELGIHPNFNFLLNGNVRSGESSSEIIKKIMDLVPGARSVRSHSLTQSSRILEECKHYGITHDINHLVPHNSGIRIKPWTMSNGLVRVPYGWEDDDHIEYETRGHHLSSPKEIVEDANYELKVYDFHPIHIYLNTEKLARYEFSRQSHHSPEDLIYHRWEGYGTRNRFIELLQCTSE